MIECMTYRSLEHCGVYEDFQLGYRTEEEAKDWHAKDPLKRAKDFVNEKERSQMDAEIAAAIDAAFTHAKSSPFPRALITEGVSS